MNADAPDSLAAVRSLLDDWTEDLANVRIRSEDARYCWTLAARELTAALTEAAQAVAADKTEAVRAGRAEALREVADAFDNGWYEHEDFRLAGVDEVATRGWSEKSVMEAWDAGSVWADFLRARAEAEQGGGE